MGLYDCTCMVTGVSVDRVGATAVILRRTAEGYEPITLGISGEYNGYGTIWSINEDRNTELVYDFFARQSRTGRFSANEPGVDDSEPFADEGDIEDLLAVIERTCACWDGGGAAPVTVLDGDVIVFAYVAQPIWDAIVESSTTATTLDAAFRPAVGDGAIPHELYDGHLSEVAEQVRQLAAISDFVRTHELRWAPPCESEQRYAGYSYLQNTTDDWLAFIATARLDYRDEPAIQRGLDACAAVVREWAD